MNNGQAESMGIARTDCQEAHTAYMNCLEASEKRLKKCAPLEAAMQECYAKYMAEKP